MSPPTPDHGQPGRFPTTLPEQAWECWSRPPPPRQASEPLFLPSPLARSPSPGRWTQKCRSHRTWSSRAWGRRTQAVNHGAWGTGGPPSGGDGGADGPPLRRRRDHRGHSWSWATRHECRVGLAKRGPRPRGTPTKGDRTSRGLRVSPRGAKPLDGREDLLIVRVVLRPPLGGRTPGSGMQNSVTPGPPPAQRQECRREGSPNWVPRCLPGDMGGSREGLGDTGGVSR